VVGVALAERFEGRSAIVTGAGSGIGAALSRALVAAGADVVCADLDLDAAEKTVASVTGPGTARAVRLDVTSAARVAALVSDVAAEHGSLDLMFNNAGISIGGETQELTLEHWDSIIFRLHPRRRPRRPCGVPGDGRPAPR
jgi:NAD(P)-dependent dehydrogenase (short-subunit alcohol dehydrogenase family)